MFFEQLKKVCSLRGTTPTTIAKRIGLSGSNAANWKKGALPSGDTIISLSKLLNVSCDYLLLGSERADDLAPEQHELLSYFNKLNKHGREQLIGAAMGMTMASEFTSTEADRTEKGTGAARDEKRA